MKINFMDKNYGNSGHTAPVQITWFCEQCNIKVINSCKLCKTVEALKPHKNLVFQVSTGGIYGVRVTMGQTFFFYFRHENYFFS